MNEEINFEKYGHHVPVENVSNTVDAVQQHQVFTSAPCLAHRGYSTHVC